MSLADELVRLQVRMEALQSTFMTQHGHLQRMHYHRHSVTNVELVEALANVNNVLSDLCEVVNELVAGMQREADSSLDHWLRQTTSRH